MREFKDPNGVHWRVWAVIPQTAERRRQPPSSEDPPVIERRVRNEPRMVLPADRGGGWLTFESETEKRRLSPIPPEWEVVDDARLAMLCQLATPTPRRPSRLIE
jgi:hypothetical protein